jgi:outer membrane murein-binding lipoprotein Lpp
MTGLALALGTAALAGCSNTNPSNTKPPARSDQPPAQVKAKVEPAGGEDAELRAERAKLSPEDRALVEAQEWCVINDDERLGSMGPPVKVMVKDQPVFLCCKSCVKKAQADPDKTLAKVEELKAKKKAEAAKK